MRDPATQHAQQAALDENRPEVSAVRSAACLALILLCAGTIRLLYVSYLPGQGRDLLHSDMGLYDKSAWSMSQGLPIEDGPGFNGYHPLSASTYIYAGYIYFVATVYAIFGHSLPALRVVQGIVSTLTVALVYVIGSAVFRRREGLVAALLTAVYLPLTYYAGLVLSETWFLFLQLAALWAWLRTWEAKSRGEATIAASEPKDSFRGGSLPVAFVAGLLVGSACITRSAFLPAFGALVASALLFPPIPVSGARRAKLVALVVLGACLVVAPITVRNYQIHKRFILVSTNGPSTFHVGHVARSMQVIAEAPSGPDVTDVDVADWCRSESLDYLRRHWDTYLAELPGFFRGMWLGNDFWPEATTYWDYRQVDNQAEHSRIRYVIREAGGPQYGDVRHFPDLVSYVDASLWVLIGLPLGILAIFFLPRSNRRWLCIYLVLLPYVIIPLIAPAFPRYRVPAAPLVFLLASRTICCLTSKAVSVERRE